MHNNTITGLRVCHSIWHTVLGAASSFFLRHNIDTYFRLGVLLAVSSYVTQLSPMSRLLRQLASCTQYAVQIRTAQTLGVCLSGCLRRQRASCTQYAVQISTVDWRPVSAAAKITAMTSADRCPHQNVGQPKEFSGRVTVSSVCLSVCPTIRLWGTFVLIHICRVQLPLIYLLRLSIIC